MQDALSCVDQPVLSYLLNFQSSVGICVFFYSNETEVMLGPQDGLDDNQEFVYTITAINSVGNATSQNNSLCECNKFVFKKCTGTNYSINTVFVIAIISVTSDVQAINATVVGESTINIQCWFIRGSDALGCKVVLVSDYRGVNNETMNITRKTNSIISVFGTFNLTQPVSCYNRVLAFDIEISNILSNVTIEGKFQPTATKNSICSGMMSLFSTHMNRVYLSIPLVGDLNHPPLTAPIAIVTMVLIIIVIVAIIIFLVVFMWHKKGMSYKVTVISMVISKVLGRDSTDGIKTTPNEVYGVSTDGIETTVYGVSTDGIETTPNEVYGVNTHPLQGHVYEVVKSIRGTSTL